jgi:hypothetical protein
MRSVVKANSLQKIFFWSAGAMLLALGVAKLYSLAGKAAILDASEPLTGMTYWYVMLFTGAIEMSIGIFCFVTRPAFAAASAILWLGLSLASYRALKWIAGFPEECPCLGSLISKIPLSISSVTWCLRGVIAYLLLGGVLSLLYQIRMSKTKECQ